MNIWSQLSSNKTSSSMNERVPNFSRPRTYFPDLFFSSFRNCNLALAEINSALRDEPYLPIV